MDFSDHLHELVELVCGIIPFALAFAVAFWARDKGLKRSKTNRWLGGVCGGLGQHFQIAPWLVRLVFVILGFSFLFYIVMWGVVPQDEP